MEKAFELAKYRLGDVIQLRREFAKAPRSALLSLWQLTMIVIGLFGAYAGFSLAFRVFPVEAGDERLRIVVSVIILCVAAVIAAFLPTRLRRLDHRRFRQLLTCVPLCCIAAAIIVLGKNGSRFLGADEMEVIRGAVILGSLCLVLASISVSQLRGVRVEAGCFPRR